MVVVNWSVYRESFVSFDAGKSCGKCHVKEGRNSERIWKQSFRSFLELHIVSLRYECLEMTSIC